MESCFSCQTPTLQCESVMCTGCEVLLCNDCTYKCSQLDGNLDICAWHKCNVCLKTSCSCNYIECSICWENVHERKIVTCLHCGITTCEECTISFLIEQDQLDAYCSSCKEPWNIRFLHDSLPESLFSRESKYISHLQSIVARNERLRIPEVQDEMELDERLEMLNNELEYLMEEYLFLKSDEVMANITIGNPLDIEQNVINLFGQYRIIKDRILEIHAIYANLQKGRNKSSIACVCPNNCKGVIYLNNLECSLCHTKICSECHQIQSDLHVCKEEDVETVKFLIENTKACPKCNSTVSKNGGCDQMFCLSCKTVFSWVTGKIDNGRIHNPEALQWLSNHGSLERDYREIPCGGLPDVGEYWDVINDSWCTTELLEYIGDIAEFISAIDNEIESYIITDKKNEITKKFIKNQITEDEWKEKCFKAEIKTRVYRSYIDILTSFRHLLVGAFRDFFEEVKEKRIESYKISMTLQLIDEVNWLKTLFEDAISKKVIPHIKYPVILHNWKWGRRVV